MKNSTIPLKYKTLAHLKVLFYLALFVNDILIYKLVTLFGVEISAASLIFPLTYLIITIIAEAYDYKEARQLVFESVFVNMLFGGFISLLVQLPSPEDFNKQAAFLSIFPDIFWHCVVHGFAAVISYSLNIYLLGKLKFFYVGRTFIMRSVTATIIGELSLTLIMVLYSWHEYQSVSALLTMLFSTYSSKLIWAILGAYPALLVIKIIQKSPADREMIFKKIMKESEESLKKLRRK